MLDALRSRVRRGLVAAAVVALVAAAVVYLVARDGADDTSSRVPPPPGDDSAVAACRGAAEFERLVQDNRPADEVLAVLRTAEQQGKNAAAADSRWIALAGGLASVRIGIQGNDGPSARTGIDVVRAECRRTQR